MAAIRAAICTALLVTLASSQHDITLTNNGYENVLISISDTVPYDANLIPAIQKLFNDASATLFKATEFRAYFREITILVPTSWNVPKAVAASTESFDRAHIRVDNPSSRYGDNPWVRQTAGCGVPGEFMHLTPKFITDTTNSVRKWGPLEKVVVHEWGHLRWGLFDEYPIGGDITEHFYQSPSTNTIEASRCNINVEGRMRHRVDGKDCKIDPTTSLPETDCRYYPDRRQSTAISSLMYFHYLPSVEKFCDDDDLGYDSVHNYEAPSQHNRLCSGRAAWTIMRETPDFKNGNRPIDSTTKDTTVKFNLVQRRESRVVVVMDVSGSMKKRNYYIKMNAAVRRYLLHTVPTGASVGLVQYSNRATALTSGLIKINNDVDRQNLANKVPLTTDGNTAIGRGLLMAMRLLKNHGGDLAGSRIILLTDGQENVSPFVNTTLVQFITAGIIVDTILLTPTASDVLISLAANTGGLSFYSSGDSKSTSLNDAFTTSERARISNPKDLPVTIESRVIVAAARNETCYNVIVDSGLGRDTTFTFSWVNANPLAITLADKSGAKPADMEKSKKAASFQCKGMCDTGKWKVCITNSRNAAENVVSQIESKPRLTNSTGSAASEESLLPITVQTSIDNKNPNFKKRGEKPVTIFASVTRGYSPVIGAKVVASVEDPTDTGSTIKLAMRDDGVGSDIFKEDGTYSAYIMNSRVKGKHTISVEVVSEEGTKVKTYKAYSSAGFISDPGEDTAIQEVELTPTDEFQRFASAGYINVKSVAPPGRDILPPSRIIDLEVTRTSYAGSSITLEWTAVGDDLDKGRASSYELWRADNHKTLYRALKNATLVTADDVIQGNLSSPRRAYSREKIVLKIPDREVVNVYAVIVRDDARNPSPLSNVISAKAVNVPKEETPVSSNTLLIVGLSVGVTVGVILIIIIVVVLVTKGVIGSRGGKSSATLGSSSQHNNKGYGA